MKPDERFADLLSDSPRWVPYVSILRPGIPLTSHENCRPHQLLGTMGNRHSNLGQRRVINKFNRIAVPPNSKLCP
jgi:hypothetical protein